jgi:hypothetical protein
MHGTNEHALDDQDRSDPPVFRMDGRWGRRHGRDTSDCINEGGTVAQLIEPLANAGLITEVSR